MMALTRSFLTTTTVDASFGITSKIILDQITTAGSLVTSLEVPNSSQNGNAADQGTRW